MPAFPTTIVRDTTGAGDSFAGAFLGFLASADEFDERTFRAAMVYGTVAASFTVEDFSIDGLMCANHQTMSDRYACLADVTRIETPGSFARRLLVVEGV